MTKIYPDSGIELSNFTAKHYDNLMNIASFGKYKGFIRRAIKSMNINKNDSIIDFGCGTGRNICIMNEYVSENSLITSLDISKQMENQFQKNCLRYTNIRFLNQRIDQPFDLNQKYNKVFISFVLHGFPQNIREIIIKNAFNHLKPGGILNILDYAEFDLKKIPLSHRIIFNTIECKYAFDFIEKNWKQILTQNGFDNYDEKVFLKNYIRLLKAKRL